MSLFVVGVFASPELAATFQRRTRRGFPYIALLHLRRMRMFACERVCVFVCVAEANRAFRCAFIAGAVDVGRPRHTDICLVTNSRMRQNRSLNKVE